MYPKRPLSAGIFCEDTKASSIGTHKTPTLRAKGEQLCDNLISGHVLHLQLYQELNLPFFPTGETRLAQRLSWRCCRGEWSVSSLASTVRSQRASPLWAVTLKCDLEPWMWSGNRFSAWLWLFVCVCFSVRWRESLDTIAILKRTALPVKHNWISFNRAIAKCWYHISDGL